MNESLTPSVRTIQHHLSEGQVSEWVYAIDISWRTFIYWGQILHSGKKKKQNQNQLTGNSNLEIHKAAVINRKSRAHDTTSLSSLPNIPKYFTHSMSTWEQPHAYKAQGTNLKDNQSIISTCSRRMINSETNYSKTHNSWVFVFMCLRCQVMRYFHRVFILCLLKDAVHLKTWRTHFKLVKVCFSFFFSCFKLFFLSRFSTTSFILLISRIPRTCQVKPQNTTAAAFMLSHQNII